MTPRSEGGGPEDVLCICCDCHRAIHALFTNKELGAQFHTVEALLENEKFSKMAKFIGKHDPQTRVRTVHSKERQGKR